MEQVQIHKKQTPAKSYKYFAIKSQEVIEAAGAKKLAFFYVGKRSAAIQSLISFFESGYTAVTATNAKSMLKRLLGNAANIITPDFIIADASQGIDQLRDFYKFIAGQHALTTVPFMADATGLSMEETERLRKLDFIDEILFEKDYSKPPLTRRVNFLKKVKQRSADELQAHSMQLSLQKTPRMLSIIKRSFDIIASLLLLALLSPVFLLIALVIKLESKGPVFYISKRAGRGYRIFDFYKFRTMHVGADEEINKFTHMNQYRSTGKNPVFFKIGKDPRTTKTGLFLRKTSLDELPQLLNVLKGDMSLVGNRPLPLHEAASLTTNEWAGRFMAPAGMTGLWQIKKKRRTAISIEERIKLDINYANRNNLLYDFWIMLNTPSALLQKDHA